MQVPRSSQWRSQLMTSIFGCWTPPTTTTITTTLILPTLHPSLMALWGILSLSLHCWVCLWSSVTATATSASLPNDKPGGPLDWLLSDKGPFHHSPEYIDFVEKNRQGFSTRYKIYRWVVTAARGDAFTLYLLLPNRYPIICMTDLTAVASNSLCGCPLKDQLCVNKATWYRC